MKFIKTCLQIVFGVRPSPGAAVSATKMGWKLRTCSPRRELLWPGTAALRISLALLPLFALCSCAAPKSSVPSNPLGVRITQTNDTLRVELNGKLFTEYYYTNVPRPFCYPIIGPGGVAMTRNFPMAKVPGEEFDHPHHRSLWFGHGPVNGVDVWTEKATTGRIRHRGFADISSGVNEGFIKTLNDWVAPDGKVLCSDEQTVRFRAPTNGVITLDFEITIHASNGDVTFGDSKEGSFAIRVAESMRVLQPMKRGEPARAGKGHIVLSTGERDNGVSAAAAKDAKREAVTWGKRAAWCDYYGPVDDKIVGFAILDHPSNPRHPTWWHVRDYGLFAANPFGQHDFESLKDHHAGDLKIATGQSITFRYRVIIHEGDEKQARIAAHFEEFAKTKSPSAK